MDLKYGNSFGTISEKNHGGGYDYEFLFPLDSKFECAICLYALRTPVQTACGHRFCKECIENCISGCNKECPIDKSIIVPGSLFHDQFVEREILQLKVKCPNETLGCSQQIELKYIENHVSACVYKPIICPNECSAQILFKNLDDHLSMECIYRPICCSHCQQPYKLSEEQVHFGECPIFEIPCELCGLVMERQSIGKHRVDSCVEAMVNCPFVESGCYHRCRRGEMKKHVEIAQSNHLMQLMGAFKKMSTYIMDLHRNMSFSRQPSFRSDASFGEGERDGMPTSPVVCFTSTPVPFRKQSLEPYKEQDDEQSTSKPVKNEVPESHEDVPEENKLKAFNDEKCSPSDRLLRSLSSKALNVDQRLLEQSIKIDKLSNKIEYLESNTKIFQSEIAGKICNGNFTWKIHNFAEFYEEMKTKGKLLHSPPFYALGYKFHLRTNVSSRDTKDFLSLYIHMMQGENDDVLNWPFLGNIKFSLMDCGDTIPKSHMVEHLRISKSLESFQRPKSLRSTKSYGYKEFMTLTKILQPQKGCFVKNDSMYIRCEVYADK